MTDILGDDVAAERDDRCVIDDVVVEERREV